MKKQFYCYGSCDGRSKTVADYYEAYDTVMEWITEAQDDGVYEEDDIYGIVDNESGDEYIFNCYGRQLTGWDW